MLLAAVLVFSSQLWGAGPRKQGTKPVAINPAYVSALAVANRFLHAWQSGDLETGMVLLSDRVRHSQNPEKFEQFFAGTNDRGFEIARGIGNRNHDRYRFAVVLVIEQAGHIKRRFSEVIVANTGKNDWAIDKLP
jgi:hypothetical protein